MNTNNLPVEHQNVPVNHRGLHDFLYSSEDEHTAIVETVATTLINNGTDIIPFEAWHDLAENAKIAGVYAVLDAEHRTQYVGYSRNVKISLNAHLTENGSQKCAFVRVQTFNFPKRQEMEDLRDAWIQELGSIPPGNDGESEMWAGTVAEAAKKAMSDGERHAYEEKKLKLRKAMADTTMNKELEAVVTNDDWSAVINAQTQETK